MEHGGRRVSALRREDGDVGKALESSEINRADGSAWPSADVERWPSGYCSH